MIFDTIRGICLNQKLILFSISLIIQVRELNTNRLSKLPHTEITLRKLSMEINIMKCFLWNL